MHWQFLLGTFAMAMSLIWNHRQFLLGISAMDKQNQKNKKNTMTRPNSLSLLSPLGCAAFFWLFFGFLVFWFVVVFLEGLAKQHKVKDLDLTLCQFSHFRGCKLAFGCFSLFYCLLWVCGSFLENHVKTMAKCRHHWGNLRDTGYAILFKTHCKNIGNQWICRTDFDIDIVESNP